MTLEEWNRIEEERTSQHIQELADSELLELGIFKGPEEPLVAIVTRDAPISWTEIGWTIEM